MPKSPDAFRTISEVADWLGIQAHVLRFWESKFTQVKPIKRAGGRRYYRPADMQLLGGIKRLLHDDGLTIKGVQKILREEGMSHVVALSQPLDDLTQIETETAGETIDMDTPADAHEDTNDDAPEAPADIQADPTESVVLPFEPTKPVPDAQDESVADAAEPDKAQPETAPETAETAAEAQASAPAPPAKAADEPQTATETPQNAPENPEPMAPVSVDQETAVPVGAQVENTKAAPGEADQPPPQDAATDAPAVPKDAETEAPAEDLPSFLRNPMTETPPAATDNIPTDTGTEAPPADAPPPAAAPRVRSGTDVEIPAPEADFDARPSTLAATTRLSSLTAQSAKDMQPLIARLTALRDSLQAKRKPAAKG